MTTGIKSSLNAPQTPIERKVYCPKAQLTLHCLDWQSAAESKDLPPIIWLHGWLDNAASFSPLIPLLTGQHRSVALDLPGHGHSAWLAPQQPYQMWEQAFILEEFITTLLGEGKPYILAGHSMGAAIAPLLAGLASTDHRDAAEESSGGCQGLILLDGCGPFFATDDICERMQQYREGWSRYHARRRKRPQIYPTLAAAIAARLNQSDLSEEAARLIVLRGLRPVDRGFIFRHDPKLRLPTAQRFAKAQVESFFKNIHCPVLLLTAEPFLLDQQEVADRAALVAQWQQQAIAGGHHFHMENPTEVAAAVIPWLANIFSR